MLMKRLFILLLALLFLLAPSALAVTEAEAQALVKAADPRAKAAKQFWIYPDGDGAWVFYGTGYDGDRATFEGGFWYVSEAQAVRLGEYSKNVLDWGLCEGEPSVFYSTTWVDGAQNAHAAALIDGVPTQIGDVGPVRTFNAAFGCMEGYLGQDSDPGRICLGVQDGKLREIAAVSLDAETARKIEGLPAIIEALKDGNNVESGDGVGSGGVEVTECLYRNAWPGRFRDAAGHPRGRITLNGARDGQPCHVNVYLDANGEAVPERGWEDEIIVWEGADKARYDVGLEVVETVTE